MKIKSVKGTNDFLPNDAEIRDYLQNKILETYKSYGFSRIYTPILEDIENLEKSDGGENLNLIYKILKRGEKLTSAIDAGDFGSLADLGLRYDLTLPLSRFYAANKDKLPTPFKCIQIDQVFRAERPQKGRDREFVQCDIDILGSSKPECEIELIDATAAALLNVGLKNFKVKVNDRRILNGILIDFGCKQEDVVSVCISLDKLDKMEISQVAEELLNKGFEKSFVEKCTQFFSNQNIKLEDLKSFSSAAEYVENLQYIISSANQTANGNYYVEYCPMLVRGQGYYTGPVFEVESADFSCSVGGGGRYDNLVGKFTNQSVPAVGFSIGFERIFSILKQKGFAVPQQKAKIAVIYDAQNFIVALKKAKELQSKYNTTLVETSNKFGKLLAKLEAQGFDGFYNVETEQTKIFKKV